jgi:hypothetical protein
VPNSWLRQAATPAMIHPATTGFSRIVYATKADWEGIPMLNACRKKRDTSSHKTGGPSSDKETKEMAKLAKGMHTGV